MEQYIENLESQKTDYHYYSLKRYAMEKGIELGKMPYSIRVLLENLIRNSGHPAVHENMIANLSIASDSAGTGSEICYFPARVIMQDFTGVPAIVDLAAMRDAAIENGYDPSIINPVLQTDLVIDHSIQVDRFGSDQAYAYNLEREYERNRERYRLLKWAQQSFENLNVYPPGAGIIHQVNLEHITRLVMEKTMAGKTILLPDTLIGTDSHTTMINGIGVLGWGVGGIEAEAVMMGQPYYMPVPEVVGVRLIGALRDGVTATDFVLAITEMLRKYNVVEKFVEFFGPSLKEMSLADRATISNMSPEYGSTCGYFPVDEQTISYLERTGRFDSATLARDYYRAQGLFYDDAVEPDYTKTIEFDLGSVRPAVSGPKRPQDRIILGELKNSFQSLVPGVDKDKVSKFHYHDGEYQIRNGSIVIAAITSCTNTSNPSVMVAAGLIAKKAVEMGLSVAPYIKTSLAPGSKVVTAYLKKAGLYAFLEKLNFHLVGYGCTTCIGNSGPLPDAVKAAIDDHQLNAVSVLSGNRNFEARINADVQSNFLTSPPLVIAFALAGRIDIDFEREAIGHVDGKAVFLKDIWPSMSEINEIMERVVTPELFIEKYRQVMSGDAYWQSLEVAEGMTYGWDPDSTYIRKPPFFEQTGGRNGKSLPDIENARVLLYLEDSITTDHISPAGAIPETYPAGRYLIGQGVSVQHFNSYGSRRGNHEVMVRGTFANVRIRNRLLDGKEGGYSIKFPEGDLGFVYDVSEQYARENTPLIVIGGKEYGTGSSRDWAAKGTLLLHVRAVIAESFERIHRSNLVGMGIMPFEFMSGENADSLGLNGTERFSIRGISEIAPSVVLTAEALGETGKKQFQVKARLNTDVEVNYIERGGILNHVFAKKLEEKSEVID